MKRPATTGAVVPSSPELARRIVEQAEIDDASFVVEFGPGTGPMTRELLEHMPAGAHLTSIERNEEFVELLQRQHPGLDIVHADVRDLRKLLAERGRETTDRVVSSLPWAVFETELQEQILQTTHDCLSEDGIFTTFAYIQGLALPRAWRFRELLRSIFSEVHASEVIWANVPPAFIYTCRK